MPAEDDVISILSRMSQDISDSWMCVNTKYIKRTLWIYQYAIHIILESKEICLKNHFLKVLNGNIGKIKVSYAGCLHCFFAGQTENTVSMNHSLKILLFCMK